MKKETTELELWKNARIVLEKNEYTSSLKNWGNFKKYEFSKSLKLESVKRLFYELISLFKKKGNIELSPSGNPKFPTLSNFVEYSSFAKYYGNTVKYARMRIDVTLKYSQNSIEYTTVLKKVGNYRKFVSMLGNHRILNSEKAQKLALFLFVLEVFRNIWDTSYTLNNEFLKNIVEEFEKTEEKSVSAPQKELQTTSSNSLKVLLEKQHKKLLKLTQEYEKHPTQELLKEIQELGEVCNALKQAVS